MSMKAMYELRDLLCEELDEIAAKGELKAGDLDIAHKLTDTIKNIDKIGMLEVRKYSRDGDYAKDGSWDASIRGNYGRGSSYRRSHYVRGHYSRDDGAEQMKEKLEGMMHGADEKSREVLMRCMEMLEE